jgi:hypothetical protein
MVYNRLRACVYRLVAHEINTIVQFVDAVWYWSAAPKEHDLLFALIEHASRTFCDGAPGNIAPPIQQRQTAIDVAVYVLNGALNSHLDIQQLLMEMRAALRRQDRVVAVLYNPYLRWLYAALDAAGIRRGPPASTFVTGTDLRHLAKISGYDLVRARRVGAFPFTLFGLGRYCDRLLRLIPGVRNVSLAYVAVLRPVIPSASKPSLSIVVPARNERGNIAPAVARLPADGAYEIEVIFVEGHSTDGTWEEIQRVVAAHPGPFRIRALKQHATGKADAVRLGLSSATHDLLTILDADLTMPPELLGRFYDAFCAGHADFINGNRLVYPMEGEAMRFLNRLGNVFFAKALSYVLDVRVGDSLCGTKLFTRGDYARFVKWRGQFGDFDPFGDFEFLFPAAILGLGIVDIPVAYRDRTYGSTNVRRFRDGLMLLKMVAVGFLKVKSR